MCAELNQSEYLMTIKDIESAATNILELLRSYSGEAAAKREMLLDPVLFAHFQAVFGHMSRQKKVHMHSKPKPQRIDFRFGTSNPVVIEFAVRPKSSASSLYGSQNTAELRKLARVRSSEARLRALLLLDLTDSPILCEDLKPTYDKQHAGKGRFKRHSVRVIYVSRKQCYNFIWKPFAR